MKEAIWAVIGAIVTAAILGGVSQLVKTETYGVEISRIKEDISEISDSIKSNNKQLYKLGVAVSSAHPEKSSELQSIASKINTMDYADFGVLVSAISNSEFYPEIERNNASKISEIMADYRLSVDDLNTLKTRMENSDLFPQLVILNEDESPKGEQIPNE